MSTEKCWGEKICENDPKKMDELTKEALQDYTNKLMESISPIDPRDLMLIIASLKTITKGLAEIDPKANAMSEMIILAYRAIRFETSVPGDATQEEIEWMKGKIYKNR